MNTAPTEKSVGEGPRESCWSLWGCVGLCGAALRAQAWERCSALPGSAPWGGDDDWWAGHCLLWWLYPVRPGSCSLYLAFFSHVVA